MNIVFTLCWGTKKIERQFHSKPCLELFLEYTNRIRMFIDCDVKVTIADEIKLSPGEQIVCCDIDASIQPMSSEEMASNLKGWMNRGVKKLNILIGPPNGFSNGYAKSLQAKTWCFGPMTLPHELAAVVASEQIYRALTILKGHPYHVGHI